MSRREADTGSGALLDTREQSFEDCGMAGRCREDELVVSDIGPRLETSKLS